MKYLVDTKVTICIEQEIEADTEDEAKTKAETLVEEVYHLNTQGNIHYSHDLLTLIYEIEEI